MLSKTKHLDCTIRDGGYLNDWNFSFQFVYRLLRVLDEGGFDFAEIGFWNPAKPDKPWRHCSIDLIKSLEPEKLSIKLVLLIDNGSCTSADIPDELLQYVKLIRVATHKKDLLKAIEFASVLKSRGFAVTINAMGITSYNQADLVMLAEQAQKAQEWCDYFYIADSFGGLVPEETSKLFHFLSTVSSGALGFHPHNNLELAVANTLAAINAGANIVDSSLLGIGRGGGNLRSEVIAAVLGKLNRPGLNPLPLLSFADAMFHQIGSDMGLAYDLEQVITGMASCHPNYASLLVDKKRLALDEIYHVIDAIPVVNKSQFSEAIIDDVIADIRSRVHGHTVFEPAVLNTGNKQHAILVCPSAKPVSFSNPDGSPVFSVNHFPEVENLQAAIFGSLRRLWQFGDYANGKPAYIIPSGQLLHSLPACEILDTQELTAKLGYEIQNSGIKSLALLIEAGFTSVDVYGMSGFSPEQLPIEEMDNNILNTLGNEALKELQLLRNFYNAKNISFTIHNSVLSNESL